MLCLVPADYAAPIRSNAARTAVDLTTAQLKAIEAAVKRKFEKQKGLGQEGNERLVWQDKTIAAATLVNSKAKLAKNQQVNRASFKKRRVRVISNSKQ